jgi:hypothetical protein
MIGGGVEESFRRAGATADGSAVPGERPAAFGTARSIDLVDLCVWFASLSAGANHGSISARTSSWSAWVVDFVFISVLILPHRLTQLTQHTRANQITLYIMRKAFSTARHALKGSCLAITTIKWPA